MSTLSDLISNELKYIPIDIVDNIILHYLDCLAHFDDSEFEIKCTDKVRRRWINSQMEIKKEYNDDNSLSAIYYFVNGKLHREDDQPAVEYADGLKYWYQNGSIHRDGDKPAILCANGTKEWYQNGIFHRDNDQPAFECVDGSRAWYQNGMLHRDGDKPAVMHEDGFKEWYQHGKRHRDGDKPAIEYPDGIGALFQHGIFIGTYHT